MDWRSFIASLVGSLSWPIVLVVLLIVLRKQIAGLADRLHEITIPGGGKASFERKIEKAREETEGLILESQLDLEALSPRANEPIEKDFIEMAEAIPEYVVVAAYADVEKLLVQLAKELDQPPLKRRLGPGFFGYLEGIKLITPQITEVLIDLYQAREIATHAKGENRISPGQAIEFLRQSRILQDVLERILAQAKERKAGSNSQE